MQQIYILGGKEFERLVDERLKEILTDAICEGPTNAVPMRIEDYSWTSTTCSSDLTVSNFEKNAPILTHEERREMYGTLPPLERHYRRMNAFYKPEVRQVPIKKNFNRRLMRCNNYKL